MHKVRIFNPRWIKGSRFLDIDEFDVVVIHYSLLIISDDYLSPAFRAKIRRFKGLKVQFIQDDYRRVDEISSMMRYMGISILFTLVPTRRIQNVWEERLPGVVKTNTLPGYMPDGLVGVDTPPMESRPIDIGYRGRILPYWLGELSQEKVWIGQGVLGRAEKYGLRCDIAWREEDRIYGQDWNRFVSSCKAMLGTESGASITDFDGSAEKRVKEYLAKQPDADFFEVQKEVLTDYEGNVPITVISPKMFEAIAMRTALILFPGDYSNILHPWVHYIPLEKDFSNMDQVVEKLRDDDLLRTMTNRAYEDIVASGLYSFRTFIQEYDRLIAKYGKPYGKLTKTRYWLARLERPPAVLFGRFCRVAPVALAAFITIKSILKNSILRKILFEHVLNMNRWDPIMVKQLFKELVLFDLINQFQSGRKVDSKLFHILTSVDQKTGCIRFVSQQNTQARQSLTEQLGRESKAWAKIILALSRGNVNKMVWDHSSIAANVQYRVIGSVYLPIKVGQNGIQEFDLLVKLASKALRG